MTSLVRKGLTLAVLAVLTLGCQEKESKKEGSSAGGSGDAIGGGGGVGAGSGNICQLIANQPGAAKFVNALCSQGLLQSMRAPDQVYRGSAPVPKVNVNANVAGPQTSSMSFWTSMRVPTEASTYYNMMQLQSKRPQDFDARGYESIDGVEYSILSNNGNQLAYRYKNTKSEEAVVHYEATSSFVVLVPNQTYMVSSKATRGVETVQDFDGLVIINAASDEQAAEIFSLSEQVYSNNDNHEKTVENARQEFELEQARSFRNSRRADSEKQQLQALFPN